MGERWTAMAMPHPEFGDRVPMVRISRGAAYRDVEASRVWELLDAAASAPPAREPDAATPPNERLMAATAGPDAGTMNEGVAGDVLACAESWEPSARLLGNVRADEIAALCRAFIRYRAECMAWRAADDANGSPFRYVEWHEAREKARALRQQNESVERAAVNTPTRRPTMASREAHRNVLEDVVSQFKGKSADEIAQMVRRRGIKGRMGTTQRCPMALLMSGVSTGDYVIGRQVHRTALGRQDREGPHPEGDRHLSSASSTWAATRS